MNKISGLLIKDLLELKSYQKSILTSIFIYIIIIILNADESSMIYFGSSMIAFLFGIYALSTLNYDEKNKTEKYLLTLPLTRKEIVLEKYLLLILSMFIGIICSSLLMIILSIFNIIKIVSIKEYLAYILGIIYSLSLMHSIQLPCIFKYGATKGRTQIYLIIISIFLVIGLIYMLFPNIDLSILKSVTKYIPYFISILIIINYLVSYKIATKIVNKKDY